MGIVDLADDYKIVVYLDLGGIVVELVARVLVQQLVVAGDAEEIE